MNIKVLVGGILFFAVGVMNLLGLRIARLGKYRDTQEALDHQKEIAPLLLSMGIGMVLWAVLDPDSQVSYAVNMLTVVLLVITLMKEFRYWTEMGQKR